MHTHMHIHTCLCICFSIYTSLVRVAFSAHKLPEVFSFTSSAVCRRTGCDDGRHEGGGTSSSSVSPDCLAVFKPAAVSNRAVGGEEEEEEEEEEEGSARASPVCSDRWMSAVVKRSHRDGRFLAVLLLLLLYLSATFVPAATRSLTIY